MELGKYDLLDHKRKEIWSKLISDFEEKKQKCVLRKKKTFQD